MSLFITNNSNSIQKMKIVVTRSNKKTQSYEVVVMDGACTVHKETVVGLKKRDEVVWKLADLYGALDIEVIKPEATSTTLSDIPSIPVLDDEEAELYFESNLDSVYDRIVQAISEGLLTNKDEIKLFDLSDTGVFFTSQKENWKSGLLQALDYYLAEEQYERCTIIQTLLKKL